MTQSSSGSWRVRAATLAIGALCIGALGGCDPAGNSADDVADEIGKALDPDPDYVDRPAPEPQRPQ